MGNLANFYNTEVVKKLKQELNLVNTMAVPKIEKVAINCGLGEAATDPKIIDKVAILLSQVTGQKPVKAFAKRPVSAFKLKKGQAIGLKVTLRGRKMYDFLEKLFKITLPRLRDFRGLSDDSFDQFGNYTLGVKEISVFPEVASEAADLKKGLEITIVTNAKTTERSKRLLELLGMPFAKNIS